MQRYLGRNNGSAFELYLVRYANFDYSGFCQVHWYRQPTAN